MSIYWHGHTNLWESFYIAPGAFGTGVIGSSLFVYLAAGVDESQMAIASTGLYLGQNIGALLGVSLASNVLFNVLKSELEKRLDGFPNKDMVRCSFSAQLGVKRSTFDYWLSPRTKRLRLLIQIIHKAVSNLDYVKKIEGPVREIIIESYIQGFVCTHCEESHVRRQYLSTDLCL